MSRKFRTLLSMNCWWCASVRLLSYKLQSAHYPVTKKQRDDVKIAQENACRLKSALINWYQHYSPRYICKRNARSKPVLRAFAFKIVYINQEWNWRNRKGGKNRACKDNSTNTKRGNIDWYQQQSLVITYTSPR